jgi:hypothetical protein
MGAGKEKTLSLGTYPDVPAERARATHLLARQLLAVGVDPALRKARVWCCSIAGAGAHLAVDIREPHIKRRHAKACRSDRKATHDIHGICLLENRELSVVKNYGEAYASALDRQTRLHVESSEVLSWKSSHALAQFPCSRRFYSG